MDTIEPLLTIVIVQLEWLLLQEVQPPHNVEFKLSKELGFEPK